VPAAAYGKPGTVTVRGNVTGTAIRATAKVRVTADFEPGQNLAAASGPTRPSADASYSGAPDTLPGALLDGVTTSGGWSNYHNKSATALLPAVNLSHGGEWTSVGWAAQQTAGQLKAYFTIDAKRALPSSVRVSYWDGGSWVPVRGLRTEWATTSNSASSLTFEPVSTTGLRLDMTSTTPGTSTGFLQLAELEAIGSLLR
jgi:beta-galactosidase